MDFFPRPVGNIPELLSQQILVGIILVGRSGVRARPALDALRRHALEAPHP